MHRHRREYGMLDDGTHSISDVDLRVLRSMRMQHLSYGETMAMGHVRSLGYVQGQQDKSVCRHLCILLYTLLVVYTMYIAQRQSFHQWTSL